MPDGPDVEICKVLNAVNINDGDVWLVFLNPDDHLGDVIMELWLIDEDGRPLLVEKRCVEPLWDGLMVEFETGCFEIEDGDISIFFLEFDDGKFHVPMYLKYGMVDTNWNIMPVVFDYMDGDWYSNDIKMW